MTKAVAAFGAKTPPAPVSAQTKTGYVRVPTTKHVPDPRHSADYMPHKREIVQAFDHLALRRVCTMAELDFAGRYGMEQVDLDATSDHKAGFYAFKDNGSDILFVAHLDTVSPPEQRMCNFVNTAAGPIVYSRSLDDRLGAYIGLELLPKLGLTFDWLLTTNEETGDSTAADFVSPKSYNWVIEFDRGGSDVVMYQYDDWATSKLVTACGAKTGRGSLSDISYLEDLGVKCFNWGTGYQSYHGPRSHAYLLETFQMVGLFLDFHAANKDTVLPHQPVVRTYGKHKATSSPGLRGSLFDPDMDPYAGEGWWDEMADQLTVATNLDAAAEAKADAQADIAQQESA